MQDINIGEKERLYQWACTYHTGELEVEYFTNIQKERESYYEKRDPLEKYGKEYTFQTMPELRRELELLWDGDEVMEQILKTVLVAAMKNKPLPGTEGEGQEASPREVKEQIKPFIYNF